MRHGKRSRTRGHRPLVDPLFAEELLSGHRSSSGRSGRQRSSENHKTLALCRQAQRALSLSLGGECGDDVLNSLYVESVVPAPDATHLLVCVVVPVRLGVGIPDVLERLERVRGILRTAVAQAITRKRVPELSFLSIAETEVLP